MGLFGPVLGSWSGEGSRKGGEVVSVVGGVLESARIFFFLSSSSVSKNRQ